MSAGVVYGFEGIGTELDLVPLAGRRALDRAGVKVSLEAWRGLSHEARRTIATLGSAEQVDVSAVRRELLGVIHTACEGRPEPSADDVPSDLAAAGWTRERWRQLRALDRWALASLASRGRTEGLAQLTAELNA